MSRLSVVESGLVMNAIRSFHANTKSRTHTQTGTDAKPCERKKRGIDAGSWVGGWVGVGIRGVHSRIVSQSVRRHFKGRRERRTCWRDR